MPVRHAETESDLRRCFPVLHQLRPHLTEAAFLNQVDRQRRAGYALAFLEERGRVMAVAGYRISECLAWGRFLYVDDLVTDAPGRSRGHGGRLLEWLVERAREAGCDELHLDCGVQRVDAHRFYEGHHLEPGSLHFRRRLEEP